MGCSEHQLLKGIFLTKLRNCHSFWKTEEHGAGPVYGEDGVCSDRTRVYRTPVSQLPTSTPDTGEHPGFLCFHLHNLSALDDISHSQHTTSEVYKYVIHLNCNPL